MNFDYNNNSIIYYLPKRTKNIITCNILLLPSSGPNNGMMVILHWGVGRYGKIRRSQPVK